MIKKIITYILIINMIISSVFIPVYEVKASVTPYTLPFVLLGIRATIEESDTYQSAYDSEFANKFRDLMVKCSEMVGLKLNDTQKALLLPGYDPWQELLKMYKAKNNNEEPTNKELGDFAVDLNVEQLNNINEDSIVLTPDYSQLIKSYIDYIKNNTGFYYVYSNDIKLHATNFNSGTQYAVYKNFIETYQDDYIIAGTINNNKLVLIPNSNKIKQYSATNTNFVYGEFYNKNWNSVGFSSCVIYDYNSQNGNLTQSNSWGYASRAEFSKININTGSIGSGVYILTSGSTHIYKMFRTLEDLKADDVGQTPYYQTQYLGDFMENSGNTTYTIDNSNYNPITYGDIQTYVDSFNTENNRYPTPEETQRYIQTYTPPASTPTPLPDNPNGGNGSTVSGNGGAYATATATNGNVNVTVNNNPHISLGWPTLSGNTSSGNTVSGNTIEGGVSDIFSFISGIGKAIGSLIKNLGTALTEIITSLTEIIDDIVVRVPYLFTQILNVVFNGLPDELKAIIVMGVTVMVLYGIIKMIRG